MFGIYKRHILYNTPESGEKGIINNNSLLSTQMQMFLKNNYLATYKWNRTVVQSTYGRPILAIDLQTSLKDRK